MISCNNNRSNNPDQWGEKELNAWFSEGQWKQCWNVSADESVNKKEFSRQYFKNPDRWKKAFDFLEKTDLTELEPGRYELDGLNLYVNVDEYQTRDEENTRFEAHRKYADIQYVVGGEEQIGVVPLEGTEVTDPYSEEKDITFLQSDQNNYRKASPDNFFIFFKNDAHRPCFKVTDNTLVRKVVVKVRID